MNDRTLIRWMLVASLVLPILGMVANEIYLRSLPADAHSTIETLTAWPDSPLALAAFLFVIAVYLVAFVGMLQFRPWARNLYLGVTAIGFAAAPLLPPDFVSGTAYAFDSLGTLCTGIVVAYILLGRMPVRGSAMAEMPA
jgi:hypothetical protein